MYQVCPLFITILLILAARLLAQMPVWPVSLCVGLKNNLTLIHKFTRSDIKKLIKKYNKQCIYSPKQ